MSKCITCGEDVAKGTKELIDLYKSKGIKRVVYKVNGGELQITDFESFKYIMKKYKRNKTFEWATIGEMETEKRI